MVRIKQVLLFLAGAMFFAACAGMPSGGGREDVSLLVVLSEIGSPTDAVTLTVPGGTVKVKPGEDGVGFVKLDAGPVSSEHGVPFIISGRSVILYPEVFDKNGNTRPVQPSDQQRAMNSLTEYVGFERWFGGEYVNFGPYRPKQYLSGEYFPLKIESSPAGAAVSIDDVVWGETPLELELTAGRYLIEISAQDYLPFRKIVAVNKPESLSPQLELQKSAGSLKKDSFRIMVAPVRFLSGTEDPYGDVIQSAMEQNFSDDSRLEILRDTSGFSGDGARDFTPAEAVGADLLVFSSYASDGETLYLEAVLYETASRRVHYAETYISEAGFAVFDSIDEISRRFSDAVGKTLPEAGEPIVNREEEVTAEMLAYEQGLYQQRMVESRMSRRNLVSIKAGMGGFTDDLDDGLGGSVGYRSNSLFNNYRLDYQRILSPHISLSVMMQLYLQTIESDGNGGNINPNVSVIAGPEFTFRSETSDVYFTPGLLLGFAPGFTAYTTVDVDYAPQFYTGFELDVGYRQYLFNRRSDRPLFFNTGMMFDIVEFAYGSGQDFRIVPIRGSVYLGAGVSL